MRDVIQMTATAAMVCLRGDAPRQDGKAGGVVVVAIDLPTDQSSPPNGGFLMPSPKWGIHSLISSAKVCVSEQMLRFHTQPN